MPLVAGKLIENLSPVEAGNKGYLKPDEVMDCMRWIEEKMETRQFNTLVYVNGVYVGVANKQMGLVKILDKFKIS